MASSLLMHMYIMDMWSSRLNAYPRIRREKLAQAMVGFIQLSIILGSFTLIPTSGFTQNADYQCEFFSEGICPYTRNGRETKLACRSPEKSLLRRIPDTEPASYQELPGPVQLRKARARVREAKRELRSLQEIRSNALSQGRSLSRSLVQSLRKTKRRLRTLRRKLRFIRQCLDGTFATQYESEKNQEPSPPDLEPPPETPPVEVLYDNRGIPHISANSDEDAFFALGWVHARHRSFQMLFRRAQAQGRLAELFGPTLAGADLIRSDKRFRTYNLEKITREAWRDFPQPERRLLLAFSAGVNRILTSYTPTNLPPAFREAGLRIQDIEEWSPQDSLLVMMGFSDLFTGGSRNELYNAERFRLDSEQMGRQNALSRWLSPNRIPNGCIIEQEQNAQTFVESGDSFLGPIESAPTTIASHGVVVKNGPNGYPAILAQPRLQVDFRDMGSVVLSSPSINAQLGMIFGAPFALVGSNAQVAWTVTSAAADNADLFRLQIDPEDDTKYLLDGAYTPFHERFEILQVKGGANILFRIRESYFGPVVGQEFAVTDGNSYALKHIFLEEHAISSTVHSLIGWMRLLRAESSTDIIETVRSINYPSAHMLYAALDGPLPTNGGIGYIHTAGVPERSPLSALGGLIPQDGTRRAADWQGMLPGSARPSLRNPPSGFLVAANNCTTSQPGADIHYDSGIGNTGRGWRLKQLIQAQLENDGSLSESELYEAMTNCEALGIKEFRALFLYIQNNFPHLIPVGNAELEQAIQLLLEISEEPTESPYEPHLPFIRALASYSSATARELEYATPYQQSPSALWAFYDEFKENSLLAFDLSPYREDFAEWVMTSLQTAYQLATRPVAVGGYGAPEEWSSNYPEGYLMKWSILNRTTSDTLGSGGDISVPLLPCARSSTLWSQESVQHDYIQTLNGNGFVSIIPGPGIDANDPASPYFRNQVSTWAEGEPHQIQLDYGATKAGCPSCEIVTLVSSPE